MNRYKAILWDVGGTLVDFRCSIAEWARGRLQSCGINYHAITDAWIEETYETFLNSEPEWLTADEEFRAHSRWARTLLKGLNLSPIELDRAAESLATYYDFYKPVDGITVLLNELHDVGLRQGVISNWAPSLPTFLQHHHLSDWFETIVYSAQDGSRKPEVAIFQRALAALNIFPEEAIFVGDNFNRDIAPARSIGMAAIQFDPRCMQPSRQAKTVSQLRQLIMELVRGRS